ncbi:Rha family transcriptional regulator [Salmonella enterica subsp. enterica]
MATVPTLAQPEISVINGQAVTSSLAVADYFTKRHDDVLKKIRALDCSPEFTARNFAVSDYTDASGRKLPCYNITRDGFAFLAMGFTGKRAAQFKEAYINAFNQMEKRCITALSLFDYLRLLRLAGVPGYISHVAVNPATGFSSPEHITAHNRACGFFVCNAPSHLNYGGLGRGAERLAGFCDDRSANPAQVTTSCLAAACGDKSKLITGAVVMTTIPTLAQPELCVIDGKVVTSSLAVADYFHKPHKDVLAKISRLDCSVEFTERNFSLSKYTDVTGRKLPCYHITRNGFAFLAMSFTGTGFKQNGDGILDTFANSQHTVRVAPGEMQVLGAIRAGNAKRMTMTSSNNSVLNAQFNLWGDGNRPTVIELDDDQGWHLYSQRNTDGSIQFVVNGQVIPDNYGNFDARYLTSGNVYTKGESDNRYVQNIQRGAPVWPGKVDEYGPAEAPAGCFLTQARHDPTTAYGVTFAYRPLQMWVGNGWRTING